MLSTRSGVIAEVGGFQFDLVPLSGEQMERIPGANRAAHGSFIRTFSLAIDVMHDVLLRSAVANDMIDPGGEDVFEEWFGRLTLSMSELNELLDKAIAVTKNLVMTLDSLETDPNLLAVREQIRPPKRFN